MKCNEEKKKRRESGAAERAGKPSRSRVTRISVAGGAGKAKAWGAGAQPVASGQRIFFGLVIMVVQFYSYVEEQLIFLISERQRKGCDKRGL